MSIGMTVAEARAAQVCRICGEPIGVLSGPVGWAEEFGEMVYPVALRLDFGAEFAHTGCLPGRVAEGPGAEGRAGDDHAR